MLECEWCEFGFKGICKYHGLQWLFAFLLTTFLFVRVGTSLAFWRHLYRFEESGVKLSMFE